MFFENSHRIYSVVDELPSIYQTDLSVSTFALRKDEVYSVSKKPLKRFSVFIVTHIPRINSGAVLIKKMTPSEIEQKYSQGW